ncbi:MAG: ABC transporter substrate-binding protein [Actinomycetota bacterium]|nr:ABC transporter substrate-binding protein [Actinomycetota bacterium]
MRSFAHLLERLPRKPFLRRSLALALLAVLLLVALAGCGGVSGGGESSDGLERVTLTLDWYPNADHAGIYAAQAEGYFEEEGLEVEIQQPSDPTAVLQLVAAGQSEFGISYENEMTNAAAREVPVRSVMAIMQEPLNSIISLEEAGITSPEDLAGKTVGYAGQSFGVAVLDTVLREAGEDPSSVEKVNVGLDLRPALTSERVDAVVDAYWNIEAVELAQEGFETNVIRLPEVGVPNYNELVIATSESYAEENPDIVRRFVGALVEGHRYALENPEAARDVLLAANEELDPEVAEETVGLTVPLFEAERIGYQDPEEWRAYVDWAVENGVLPGPVEVDEVMTNEFLPESQEEI